ncbi:hypothetical protein EVAR_80912_1 [Eumeta japonica]|uniref:Uncharacterized protein n=1 Tax=Eumeta variegata TaxID=151549 RepID=A0A4C1V099_EUMVA|nr:hypothetical protein EVAR_80912_1 [Eumeta japonica]
MCTPLKFRRAGVFRAKHRYRSLSLLVSFVSSGYAISVHTNVESISAILAGGETWLCCYLPERKQQSCVWTFEGVNKPTKLRQARSVAKKMIPFVFFKTGSVYTVPLEEQKTVNSEGPDLAPWDFFIFPKIKDLMRGLTFVGPEEVVIAFNQHRVLKAFCGARRGTSGTAGGASGASGDRCGVSLNYILDVLRQGQKIVHTVNNERNRRPTRRRRKRLNKQKTTFIIHGVVMDRYCGFACFCTDYANFILPETISSDADYEQRGRPGRSCTDRGRVRDRRVIIYLCTARVLQAHEVLVSSSYVVGVADGTHPENSVGCETANANVLKRERSEPYAGRWTVLGSRAPWTFGMNAGCAGSRADTRRPEPSVRL